MGVGKAVALGLGATAVGISALAAPFVTPALRRVCIPYVPATDTQLANIRSALAHSVRPAAGAAAIDLGSGDGRVVSLL